MNPRGSVALVTGANRGLGRHLVAALARSGAKRIYAAARDPATITAISIDGAEIVPVRLDVTVPAKVASVVAEARDVTLLVNNAGVLPRGHAMEIAPADLTRSLAVNLVGPWQVTRAFGPAISANGGGAIVNVLTLLSLYPEPAFAAYAAAKTAAWSLTRSLRADLAGSGVRVVAAFPGGIDTDMLAGVAAEKARPADVAQAIVAGLAAGALELFPDRVSAALGPMALQRGGTWSALA